MSAWTAASVAQAREGRSGHATVPRQIRPFKILLCTGGSVCVRVRVCVCVCVCACARGAACACCLRTVARTRHDARLDGEAARAVVVQVALVQWQRRVPSGGGTASASRQRAARIAAAASVPAIAAPHDGARSLTRARGLLWLVRGAARRTIRWRPVASACRSLYRAPPHAAPAWPSRAARRPRWPTPRLRAPAHRVGPNKAKHVHHELETP